MKEILIYCLAAVASLSILGYSIHMFVGGLVAPETEHLLIGVGCGIGLVVMGLMAYDVARRRR